MKEIVLYLVLYEKNEVIYYDLSHSILCLPEGRSKKNRRE